MERINESYLTLYSKKIKLLSEKEYEELAKMDNSVYLCMSSKNMKDIQNKIIELKRKMRK